MPDQIVIDTEHGPALVWWDDQPGVDPGWVLRYSNGVQADLDEILDFDDSDDLDVAHEEALHRLATWLRIGAGERLTTARAAALAGISPSAWRADVARGRAPAPEGRFDARTPWWWTTTVIRARGEMPGRGTRTDLRTDRRHT